MTAAEHGTLAVALTCDCNPCSVALMGAMHNPARPGCSITKAEHDALMAHRDRPITQDAARRHHSSGNGHQLGNHR